MNAKQAMHNVAMEMMPPMRNVALSTPDVVCPPDPDPGSDVGADVTFPVAHVVVTPQ